jgi:hypothetical protein
MEMNMIHFLVCQSTVVLQDVIVLCARCLDQFLDYWLFDIISSLELRCLSCQLSAIPKPL